MKNTSLKRDRNTFRLSTTAFSNPTTTINRNINNQNITNNDKI
jgi:hypothetical protein